MGGWQWTQSSPFLSSLIHTHSLSDLRPPALLSREAHAPLHSCPCWSHRPLTSKLIFPQKQSLPIHHFFMGPRSHLDSSLPFTTFSQAKQPPETDDSAP